MNNLIRLFSGILIFIITLHLNSCKGKYEYPYQDPSRPLDRRVSDLVSRMTVEEKISQMMHDADSVSRLGIQKYNWWNECLHGVARAGNATVFPQAIGMAATWDTALIYRLATAVSDEARAKHHYYKKRGSFAIYQGLTFWSPNINIFRDPRWGRGMETYGEDPFLTGRIAVEFIKGLQGNDPKYLKLVATSKHYVVHSGPEPDRHTFNAVVSRRDLLETYLPAFEMTVRDADVHSMMCAYNRTNGEVCCGSDYLLTRLFRDTLGFDGYIVSDCGAIRDFYEGHKVVNTMPEAAATAVKAGTDLNCGNSYKGLAEALRLGLISEKEIDVSVKRLMKARFQLGMFDPDEIVPYSKIPMEVVECEKHLKIAEEAARASMVLLKNDNKLLPLDKNIKTLAVIGPNADDVETLYGNYNGFSKDPVTPLEGIIKKLPGTKVLYARGCNIAENMIPLDVIPAKMLFVSKDMKEQGVRAEFYNNSKFEGQPFFTRTDSIIDFNWWDGVPAEGMKDNNYSVRWSGFISAPVSGEYSIGFRGNRNARLEFNGEQVRRSDKKIMLQKGRMYSFNLEFVDNSFGMAAVSLVWHVPGKDLKAEALKAAKEADAVVMCMGLSPRLEGEEMRVDVEGFKGGDRVSLDLPKVQSDLIRTIHSLGKPVILVLINGSAVSVNWEKENIPAILEAWYPGQAAGTALADILFGDCNPSGRLPVTFYKSEKDLPDFTDYAMEGKTYRYFRKDPLFEFGFGLSYTTFSYKNLVLPASACTGDPVKVSVDVTNSGEYDGHEVIQLYVTNKTASVTVPIRTLKGFSKIFLKKGQTATVEMTLRPEDFSIIDEKGMRVIEPGFFSISMGGCQPTLSALSAGKAVTGEIEIK